MAIPPTRFFLQVPSSHALASPAGSDISLAGSASAPSDASGPSPRPTGGSQHRALAAFLRTRWASSARSSTDWLSTNAAPSSVGTLAGAAYFEFDDGRTAISIRRTDDGYRLLANPPPLRCAVFSGGGAKGAAYPGAVRALENSGALDGIRTLYGSSAGAISAALIAAGMDAREFEKKANELDFMALIEKAPESGTSDDAAATRSASAGQKGAAGGGRWALLRALHDNIGTTAPLLERTIDALMRESILRRIRQGGTPPAVDHVRQRLESGKSVCFGDLQKLAVHVAGIKDLHCTAVACIDGRAQLAIHNAQTAPDMPVCTAVHMSAALPRLFAPVQWPTSYNREGDKTAFIDGGVLLNTPVPSLADFGNPASDSIVFVFEKEAMRQALLGKLSHRRTFGSWLLDAFAGADHHAAEVFMLQRLVDEHSADLVVVPLRFGDRDYSDRLEGTLNFQMGPEEKQQLQQRLEEATADHLQRRAERRLASSSDSLEGLLLTLDDERLELLAAQGDGTPAGAAMPALLREALAKVREFRCGFRQLLAALREAVARLAGAPFSLSDAGVAEPLREMSDLAGRISHGIEHAAEALAYADDSEFQRVLDVASAAGATGNPVLDAAVKRYRERNAHTVAFNITRHFIYPAKAIRGQSEHNLRLLGATEAALAEACTAEQINAALSEFTKAYRPVSILGPRPLSAFLDPGPECAQEAARTISENVVAPALNGGRGERESLEYDVRKLAEVWSLRELEMVLEQVDTSVASQVAPYLDRLKDIVGDSVLLEAQTWRLREPKRN